MVRMDRINKERCGMHNWNTEKQMALSQKRYCASKSIIYCILHNLILEFDGLDDRWEEEVNWDQINPQPDNSDEGSDLDDEVGTYYTSAFPIIQAQKKRRNCV